MSRYIASLMKRACKSRDVEGGDPLLASTLPAKSDDQFVCMLSGLLCSGITEWDLMTVPFCHKFPPKSWGVSGVGGHKLPPCPTVVALDEEKALANFGEAAASEKFMVIGER